MKKTSYILPLALVAALMASTLDSTAAKTSGARTHQTGKKLVRHHVKARKAATKHVKHHPRKALRKATA